MQSRACLVIFVHDFLNVCPAQSISISFAEMLSDFPPYQQLMMTVTRDVITGTLSDTLGTEPRKERKMFQMIATFTVAVLQNLQNLKEPRQRKNANIMLGTNLH